LLSLFKFDDVKKMIACGVRNNQKYISVYFGIPHITQVLMYIKVTLIRVK